MATRVDLRSLVLIQSPCLCRLYETRDKHACTCIHGIKEQLELAQPIGINLATFKKNESRVPEPKQPAHSASSSVCSLIMRRRHVFVELERPRIAPANVLGDISPQRWPCSFKKENE